MTTDPVLLRVQEGVQVEIRLMARGIPLEPLVIKARGNVAVNSRRVQSIQSWTGWRCFNVLLNHHVRRYSGSLLDTLVDEEEIMGIEIYQSASDIPKELITGMTWDAVWPSGSAGRCGIAIVWTKGAW
ncbi:MAG: hypothetical protein ACRENP_28780 [Longimicrobiales bacterium]